MCRPRSACGRSTNKARLGLPVERSFATKLELALRVVDRLQANDVPFEAVDCDFLSGRKGWLRDQLAQRQIEYYADVPENTRIYWARPRVFFPTTKRGQSAKRPQVLGVSALVKELIDHAKTVWHPFVLRTSERGPLVADFARHRIWTVDPDGTRRQEWLLIRRDAGQITYSLSYTPGTAALLTMAERKSQRFWLVRANQDAKSELGWDEFQAIMYRAWPHREPSGWALTILASWFITETRLDWAQPFPRDPLLLQLDQTDLLPKLSVANVRTLLRAAMPLSQLSPHQAAELIVKPLANRTPSRLSRLAAARSP